VRSAQGHESRDGSSALGNEDLLALFGGVEIAAELGLEACHADPCHMTMMVTSRAGVNLRVTAADGERCER
jgi:hypothetical protein